MKSPPPSARELFLEAATQDPGEGRGRWLEEACAGDAALREEVEALLREQAQLGDFLESPALEDDTLRSHTTEKASGTGQKSEWIGPYKLLQEIGEGGCGMVYMAEQETPVRRRVAVKVIKLGMDTKSVIARFESERQALAMMDHPNIAKVLDAGTTGRGRPYFVMELVRGIPITEYVDQHKLTVNQRLKLFIQVSLAIQHAHQKGIIHRDIKPSNILVTLHDGVPVPKIIDFGIAKATEQRLTDKTLFTEFQSFIGTPAYMSPEQAELSGLDIDTRSDIYSLGVLLYELLVGRTPFDARELRNSGLDACRQTIREVEPERPSQRVSGMDEVTLTGISDTRQSHSHKLIHQLRGDLDWIVMKCLEKDRQRRYPTAYALATDVQHYLDGDLVSARPPSTLYRLQKTFQRHRVAVISAGLVLVSLTAATSLASWQALRATRAQEETHAAKAEQEALRKAAEDDREKAEASAAVARMNEYVAEMNLAHQALHEGNLGRAAQLVEKHGVSPDSTATDLRGFEWRYLQALCEGDPHEVLVGERDGAVEAVAYSPPGDLLAVSTRKGMNPRNPDGTTEIWKVSSRTNIISLPTSPSTLSFSPDGHTLYTGGPDGVQAWSTRSWISRPGPTGFVDSIAVSADGLYLLAASRRRVALYQTDRWELLWRSSQASSPVAFSHNGRQFLTDTDDKGLTLRRVPDGTPMVTLQESEDLRSWAAQFTHDDRKIIAPRNRSSGRGAFVLSLWDAATGEEVGTLPSANPETQGHASWIKSMSLSADGRILATASFDHSIGLWNMEDLELIRYLKGHRHEVWGLTQVPSKSLLVSGSKDGSIYLWDDLEPQRNHVLSGQGAVLGLSPKGQALASLDARSNTLRILDLPSQILVKTVPLLEPLRRRFRGSPVTISRDFSLAAQIGAEGAVHLIDLATSQSRTVTLGEDDLQQIALSPRGDQCIALHRGQAAWWALSEPATMRQPLGDQVVARFSDDGRTLVAMNASGHVRVWDGETGQERQAFQARSGSREVALSPDGTLLATSGNLADAGNGIWLWETATGTLCAELNGHKQPVRSLAFSADGRTLASSSWDSSLKLWHVRSGRELITRRDVGTILQHLQFSMDGQWLAADGGALSPFATADEIHLFHAPRNL